MNVMNSVMLPQVAQHLAAHSSGHAHPGGVAGDPMGEYYDMFGSPYYEAYDELGYQVYTCSTVRVTWLEDS